MLRSSNRQKLLKKRFYRAPHQRNRDSSIATANKAKNYINDNKGSAKKIKSNNGYKLSFRSQYFEKNNGDEEELKEDDSS